MTVSVLPPDLQALFQQAAAQHGAGNLQAAQRLYREVLSRAPHDAEVLGWLGAAECASGQFEDGLRTLDRAISLDPNQPLVHYNRGNALQYLNRFEAALAAFDRALALAPNYPDAWGSRGTALQMVGRLDEALASHDRAVALRPDFGLAHSNRGNVLWKSGRHKEALASYDRALGVWPNFVPAHVARGSVLQELGYAQEAIASFDLAIALDPACADAYCNRANARADLRQYEAALADYDKALSLQPGMFSVPGQAQHMRMQLCDWAQFDARIEALLAAQQKGGCPVLPLALHAMADALQGHLAAASAFTAGRFPATGRVFARLPAHDRIRVGYFSSDFKTHPVSQLMAGVLERHDRDRFEIHALALTSEPDDLLRLRVKDAVEHFVDLSGRSDPHAADLSRNLEIDIAVDLNGATTGGRIRLFADRAAPVQVGYLGYLGTMGAGYYDYLIADRVIIPEDMQAFYSEAIAYLPSFQANDAWAPVEAGADRAAQGLPEKGFVFCSFNQNYKLTPEVFSSWMRILARVPDSVLWLYASNPVAVANLKAEAVRRGIDEARLIFAANVPLDQHMLRMKAADLFLDSHPYNAGATASNALRAGLPVLTRLGRSFPARMGASLLEAVGMPELIAATSDAYEGLAVELATRPERLAAVRRKLAESLPTCRLFDVEAFTRSLEAAYVAMYQRHRDGLPPEHIRV
jgi:predicted O-linked N-acetylglucosamine transferase (SPINDLY family)